MRENTGASAKAETGSREPDPSFTGSGPSGFDPARCADAVRRVAGYTDVPLSDSNRAELLQAAAFIDGTSWRPFATAPKAPRKPFLAYNHDGEVWVASFDEYGRVMYRMNFYRECTKYEARDIGGERWLKEDEAYREANSGWTSNWTFWSRGYDFEPTLWMPLLSPKAIAIEAATAGDSAGPQDIAPKGSQ